jgi:large subunit ribosomal protein L15
MQQHQLRPPRGAKRGRKRVGRGNASGKGTYAGKGMKGQQARAGSGPHRGFEGGQTPLIRRLPVRRGFQNINRVEFAPVNLRDFARLPAGGMVTPDTLLDAGLIDSPRKPVKVLATGEVESSFTVRVHRVSAAARAKIEAAGGSVEELTPRQEKVRNRKHRRSTTTTAPSDDSSGEQPAKENDDSDTETSDQAASSD